MNQGKIVVLGYAYAGHISLVMTSQDGECRDTRAGASNYINEKFIKGMRNDEPHEKNPF